MAVSTTRKVNRGLVRESMDDKVRRRDWSGLAAARAASMEEASGGNDSAACASWSFLSCRRRCGGRSAGGWDEDEVVVAAGVVVVEVGRARISESRHDDRSKSRFERK